MKRLALFSLVIASAVSCGKPEPEPEVCGGDGVICTWMGDGIAGLGEDGVAPENVRLYLPLDLTWGPDARPYVVDWNNHRIRTVEDGLVQTYIGTGELGDASQTSVSEVRLNHPTQVAFSPDGKLFLAAWHNSKVLEIDMSSGALGSVCGTGARSFGGEGGPATAADIDLPSAVAFDSSGRMYVMDQGNQRIRRVDADGTLNTVMGPVGPYVPDGFVEVCEPPAEEGQAPDCRFCLEAEMADPNCAGPPARPQGFTTSAAGTETYMHQPFSQSAPPSAGMEMGPDDVLYFVDTGNHLVRALQPDGTVITVAGTEPAPYEPTEAATKAPTGGYAGDGGPATEALLNGPRDLAVARDGTIFIADRDNGCIRKVTTDGVITTAAGVCGTPGFDGDGGPATEALLDRPYGVALDADGSLHIADTFNHRIRIVRAP